MDFTIPARTQQLLDDLDAFIDDVIEPMEQEDDNIRFFDHRREDARTDWDRDGLPNAEWEALLVRMRKAADEAGFYRWHLPERFGGKDGTNLDMAIVREHLARRGLGLHNDLQNESSIVGNLVTVLMMEKFGSEAQQAEWIPKMLAGEARIGFGLTEPLHGSDATWMETTAVRDGDEWIINGEKYWNTGLHHATHDYIFARTSGNPGEGTGITCFITPVQTPGFQVKEFMWTFNMPTDHAHVVLERRPGQQRRHPRRRGTGPADGAAVRAREPHPPGGARRSGAGLHCIDVAVDWANNRTTFGKKLSTNQAIQFPLAELYTEAEMLRALIWKTAWQLDEGIDHMEITDKVAMCNYRGNRFCCDAADRAHADLRWRGLRPPDALRAHLPPPPPLPDHRGLRGDPDPQGRRLAVRLQRPRQGLTRRVTPRAVAVAVWPVAVGIEGAPQPPEWSDGDQSGHPECIDRHNAPARTSRSRSRRASSPPWSSPHLDRARLRLAGHDQRQRLGRCGGSHDLGRARSARQRPGSSGPDLRQRRHSGRPPARRCLHPAGALLISAGGAAGEPRHHPPIARSARRRSQVRRIDTRP